MRRGIILFISLLIAFAFLPVYVSADEVTESLESRILESFDTEDRTSDWLVRGSKFISEDYPRQTYAPAWPDALHGVNREEVDYQVLGVNARFDRQGYNYLEFIPVKTGDDGEVVANPLEIEGRVKYLDMWIWGSQFDYYVDVHIEDYTGVVWTLNLGDINYTGWRNLRVEIPHYIPQSETYIPYLKSLKLVKFVVWTRPSERVADFYMYFDQIKVLTDTFESTFDGDDLTWPDKTESIWSEVE
ncbi:MAG: flagellar filament outer layer protein FlaA [Spirochaetales bacterium]|nr:flagellar filament outer layer protein FlaA [Spirochaetales bacterium]